MRPININSELRFSHNPVNLDLTRSRFDLSHGLKTTFNVGDLVPILVQEVLPGDTFDISTNKVVRLQTLLKPTMDNLMLDTYFFYCPNRLLWDHWEQFCGSNDKAWTVDQQDYEIPALSIPYYEDGSDTKVGFLCGSLGDYLSLPTETGYDYDSTSKSLLVSALPLRAYIKIVNDWFRDENLSDALVLDTSDATTYGSNTDGAVESGAKPYVAAKYHDYFTSCLPSSQRGSAVTIPGSTGGIVPVGVGSQAHSGVIGTYPTPQMSFIGTNVNEGAVSRPLQVEVKNLFKSDNTSAVSAGFNRNQAYPSTYTDIIPTNLWTEVPGGSSISVNDLRLAFQMQKFYERAARGGTRYVEVLKSQFGVTSPDARLQRSEYLGGNRIPITVREVTNNAQTSSADLGNLGAYSHTVDSSSDVLKSFTEHGYVIGLCVARYEHTYPQGLPRFYSRRKPFDFYWPVFSNISEQPVLKSEIVYTGDEDSDNATFGYQEAWADYRINHNKCTGEMRPNVSNSIAVWHYADDYAQVPTLSDEWIHEDKTNVDRTLGVTSSVSNQILADIYFRFYASRVMPVYSVPGLIDHN